jgi:hypothetical protein
MNYENLTTQFPDQTEFSPKELIAAGMDNSEVNDLIKNSPKVRRGVYDLSMALGTTAKKTTSVTPITAIKHAGVSSVSNGDVYIPKVDKTFVAWGNFADITKIIKSGMFYPTYVSGLSGNGKTFMVEQACARARRQYVRVQISPETDEDDLIGGFRLIDGETVFQKGPVIKAMEAGAILMIDEIDRGTNKIMCLQGILEGNPVMIKKTGEVIVPAEGFNVIATANTKGKGSEDGRFSAATIIDEAFLERFVVNIDQTFPSIASEKKIVMAHMVKFEAVDAEFCDLLVAWADVIRKTFYDDGIDDVISTRRLCHIVQTFSVFGKREKAVALCVNRFDDDIKEAFKDLYDKVDPSIATNAVEDEGENLAF